MTEKLSAARARRQAGLAVQPALEPDTADADAAARARASRVAATVAARYAQAPTYREYLASEVRAAVAAAVDAQAKVSEAERVQQQEHKFRDPDAELRALSAPLEQASEITAGPERAKTARRADSSPVRRSPVSRPNVTEAPRVDHAASGFQYAGPTPAASVSSQEPAHNDPQYSTAARGHAAFPPDLTGREAVCDALCDPWADALITPATPLPANLLEFPRELIAARKARPRHAEGPLRDGAAEEPQLRIFEVEANAVSTQVEVPQATEWSSIRLGAHPDQFLDDEQADMTAAVYPAHAKSSRKAVSGTETASNRSQSYASQPLPAVAGISDRLMAALVDLSLVGIAFLLFVLVFAISTAHPPAGRPVLIGGAVVLAMLYLGYQLLFFTFAEGTPGMRYARIALCTFDDENPSRKAMRKRILALLLAAAPLGLGFLYVLFDEDTLGWHDRMTRMYQRTYK